MTQPHRGCVIVLKTMDTTLLWRNPPWVGRPLPLTDPKFERVYSDAALPRSLLTLVNLRLKMK
jgi:hypothetical protein